MVDVLSFTYTDRLSQFSSECYLSGLCSEITITQELRFYY
jgi:hypothetical protein